MKFLIVVDMQNDFITGSLGTAEARAILPGVTEKVRNFDGKIIFTKDTHHSDYLQTQEGRNLPVEHCIMGQEGWMLEESLEDFAREKECAVHLKPTFGSLELARSLEEWNRTDPIEEIQLCGLCTDICVISNALLLKAFLPEVPISVDADCCAGVTPQSHANALEAMKLCQITIHSSL